MDSTRNKKEPVHNTKEIQQIPCPSCDDDGENDNSSNNKNDYSLVHLQRRAQWLIDHHDSIGKLCVAVAGGGGHAVSTLAATPGASQLLLEGTILYDRASFQTYVQKRLPLERKSGFSFSSLEAAQMASTRALIKGLQLQAQTTTTTTSSSGHVNNSLDKLRYVVGVGSASTLKTTTQGGMSKSGRPSHGNIVATMATANKGIQQVCMQLTLNCPSQNRFQQDLFVSHMLFQILEHVSNNNTMSSDTTNGGRVTSNSNSSNGETSVDPREFDGVTIEHWASNNFNDGDNNDDPILSAAHRILSGEQKAVLLLPKSTTSPDSSENGSISSSCDFLEPLLYPVLPENCLIFPGSFNPPHKGHIELAKAAIDKLFALDNNYDSNPGNGYGNSFDSADIPTSQQQRRPLVFEISIKNADKPAMEPDEVARRVAQFREVLYNNSTAQDSIPQWGILLTSAPLFAEKVRDLKQYAPPSLQPDPHFPLPSTSTPARWSFVIGTDTMVRILNPKYYNNDYDQMLQAQRSMGADFVVGGRLEQTDKETFVTGREDLERLPSDIQDMFVLLEESDFRVDISSTELRAQQEQQTT